VAFSTQERHVHPVKYTDKLLGQAAICGFAFKERGEAMMRKGPSGMPWQFFKAAENDDGTKMFSSSRMAGSGRGMENGRPRKRCELDRERECPPQTHDDDDDFLYDERNPKNISTHAHTHATTKMKFGHNQLEREDIVAAVAF
jgi:hypothetical protein